MTKEPAALAKEAEHLFSEYLGKIEKTAGLLTKDEVWWRPNSKCNSVGNLLLHLCGNLSEWGLAGIGGETFERHRPEEFAAVEGEDGAALLARLRTVVNGCRRVAREVPAGEFERSHTIQGMTRTGFGVLLHAVEHMAYHTGQIVYVSKQLAGERADIEFYPQLKK